MTHKKSAPEKSEALGNEIEIQDAQTNISHPSESDNTSAQNSCAYDPADFFGADGKPRDDLEDWQWAKIFTAVCGGDWAKFPITLIHDTRMREPGARLFGCVMFGQAFKTGICQLSRQDLAHRFGCNKKTAKKYIRALKATGWIVAWHGASGKSGEYVLNMDWDDGVQFGVMPMDILCNGDRKVWSDIAKIFYADLCCHAKIHNGHCRRSLERAADDLGCSKRALSEWSKKIELTRRALRISDVGHMGYWRLLRDPGEMAQATFKAIENDLKRRILWNSGGRRACEAEKLAAKRRKMLWKKGREKTMPARIITIQCPFVLHHHQLLHQAHN